MIGLACASLSCDGFGDNDFANTFRYMPEIGFRFVEFNCWHPSTLTPAKMQDLRERCAKAGLKPASIHGSSFGGEGNHAITKDVTHKIRMMEAAKELGCSMVCATGSARGSAGGLTTIITVLQEIAPAAEEFGVQVSLENHVGNNLENIEDYQRIFAAVNSPNIGICLDSGHFDAAAVSIDDLIDTFRLRINHIHLKENDGFGVKNFTKFGAGTTDNHGMVKRMIGLGYSGFLVVELSPEISGGKYSFQPDDLAQAQRMFAQYASI